MYFSDLIGSGGKGSAIFYQGSVRPHPTPVNQTCVCVCVCECMCENIRMYVCMYM